jgi:hypothetical protein
MLAEPDGHKEAWHGRFSFAPGRRYGALTDKVTVAQLILVRSDYPAVDRALYIIERQGRAVCRGEARFLLSQT